MSKSIKPTKSIFQQFVEANESLIECYEAVDLDQYKGQPAGKSAGLCIKEKSKLQDIVKSNEMNMTRVVQERIAILRALETKPVTYVTETDLKFTQ